MAVRLKDLQIALADETIETAIASMLSGDDSLKRVDALRLLTNRMVRANRVNRHRVRTSAENPGAQ